ncbi:MAG: type II toxin-antitoxin system RelE/ParE family toxin [Acidobacteria bacterium]|nr:type II toxin-antitoxin system RelE/ParE family toxin [Acidobacteriota bacterium]
MKITVYWSPEARADLRAIERETAMQILHSIDRYLASRTGDVKKLKPPRIGFRLRCGDYRVFFELEDDDTIQITGVKNRREAYR